MTPRMRKQTIRDILAACPGSISQIMVRTRTRDTTRGILDWLIGEGYVEAKLLDGCLYGVKRKKAVIYLPTGKKLDL